MSFAQRPLLSWRLRTRTLALGAQTAVMGIVNVTPDSFSEGAGGAFATATHEAAIARALQLLDDGAAIVDIGGESTRPGSHAATEGSITAAEEQARVLPVIKGVLHARPDALLSIDTYRAGTARAAVVAGCEIVNDVSGLTWDADMAQACGALGCGVVVMHTRGRPHEWQHLPRLLPEEVAPMVGRELRARLDAAVLAGVALERIVLDPGYGFGKAFESNYALLAAQAEFLTIGRPLLAGVSRKSFLGRSLQSLFSGYDAPASQRATATIAATVAAVLAGSSIVRVHDVRAAAEAVRIADEILAAGARS